MTVRLFTSTVHTLFSINTLAKKSIVSSVSNIISLSKKKENPFLYVTFEYLSFLTRETCKNDFRNILSLKSQGL